ncbi:MAG: (2Fe-2S)-binding protein [Actinobacteria bacterium]|nr:(2Fe-2S)-binding protein [Actinomycetota bacterium]
MAGYPLEVTVNGEKIRSTAEAGETLLRFLRRRLGLTDTKCGCEKGDCGTCAVILDGKAVKSCLVLALQANGKEVLTLKGVAREELGRQLQESFVRHGAVQCGFCTPGMIVAAKSFLEHHPRPTREQIREAISGNLCRCTGYQKIVDAIYSVAAGAGE